MLQGGRDDGEDRKGIVQLVLMMLIMLLRVFNLVFSLVRCRLTCSTDNASFLCALERDVSGSTIWTR